MKISLQRIREIIREELISEKLDFAKVVNKYNKNIVDNALALAKQHAIKDKHRGSKQTPKLIAIKTINRMKEYRNKTKGDLKNLFQKTISKLEKQYKRIKEGKLKEGRRETVEIPLRQKSKVSKILKKLRLKPGKDWTTRFGGRTHFILDMEEKYFNKTLEQLIKNKIKVRG